MVHHARDAVKPETVKLVLIYPPARIGQQETQTLPVACTQQQCQETLSYIMIVRLNTYLQVIISAIEFVCCNI